MLLSVLLAASAVLVPQVSKSAPQPPVLEVNCDSGQALDAAFRKVQGVPGATVVIRGTCIGNFFVEGARDLEIRSHAPGAAILEASPDRMGTVLDVRDSRGVRVSGLTIRNGSAGVAFRYSSKGAVAGCDISGTTWGVLYYESDFGDVRDSSIHDNLIGVDADGHSSVDVYGCTILRNLAGVGAIRGSWIDVGNTEIAGSGGMAVLLSGSAGGQLSRCALHDNTYLHVFAADGCRLDVYNSRIGSTSDATTGVADLRESSFRVLLPPSELYGSIELEKNSYLELQGSTLHGGMRVDTFSKAFLSGASFDAPVTCGTGGDVACDHDTTVPTSGCASATACGASAAASYDNGSRARFEDAIRRAREIALAADPRGRGGR